MITSDTRFVIRNQFITLRILMICIGNTNESFHSLSLSPDDISSNYGLIVLLKTIETKNIFLKCLLKYIKIRLI